MNATIILHIIVCMLCIYGGYISGKFRVKSCLEYCPHCWKSRINE